MPFSTDAAEGLPPAPSVPWRTRARLRVRHARRIAGDLGDHAAEEGLWWLVPFATVLALFAMTLVATQTALPVTVYTLF